MNLKKNLSLLFSILSTFILIVLIFDSCSKKDSVTHPGPLITAVSPLSDTIGATITITGNNFSTNAADNIVKFNGVAAVVSSATSTQLIITVPVGATTGPVSVTVNGQTATFLQSFTVTGPTITSFLPSISGIGYPIVITGSNFSSDTNSIVVTINGIRATVLIASTTQLTVIVPMAASTGKITVTVKGQQVSSATNIVIKKLTVTTIAGSGTAGFSDGTGNAASFSGPWGIVADGNGNYYVADTYNNRIREVTAAGVVTTVAGTDLPGNMDGPVATATFGSPFGVALDSHGNIFITNLGWNNIREIATDGTVSTFAGDPNGNSGTADGTGTAARFFAPLGIVLDANDNIFVADAVNRIIRKITPAGVVTTFAGSGAAGSVDGIGTAASFNTPYGLGKDANGNLYVVDPGNNNIRKITPAGVVSTFAGNGTAGSIDGPALSANFDAPIGIVADHAGNFYVTDENSGRIRMITSDGFVVTLAGNNATASIDGVGNFASFAYPIGITINPDDTMFMIDNGTSEVRKMVVQ